MINLDHLNHGTELILELNSAGRIVTGELADHDENHIALRHGPHARIARIPWGAIAILWEPNP